MNTIPYNENTLAHQEPFRAVSAWQQWNDSSGSDAMADALASQRAQQFEAMQRAEIERQLRLTPSERAQEAMRHRMNQERLTQSMPAMAQYLKVIQQANVTTKP